MNIPTDELRDLVADDEKSPTTVRYPRDPSLDPQLVWRGKDVQDGTDLEVLAVPIYIQEKIDPRAIVENLRDTATVGDAEPEMTLFADYDGLSGYELVEFYEHEGNWANRLILGDSLLAMTSLVEKERMRGKVQMIYVDPPYGIKFGSNWQVSTRTRDVKDGNVDDVTRQPEQIKAFRDTWELGIHSYLSYLRDRLTIARELLTQTGSIFVQIGDENVHLVRAVMDEVFGSENFVALIAITKSGGGLESTSRIPTRLDYIIWYGRDGSSAKYHPLFEERSDLEAAGFTNVMLPSGETRPMTREEKTGSASLPPGSRVFRTESLTKPGPGSRYTIEWEGASYTSGNRWWGNPKETVEKLLRLGRVRRFGNTLRYIRFIDDFGTNRLSNLWDGIGGASDPTFVVQTNTKIVERCMLMTTDPGDLVLDPTCGSGTTAYVAEEWGRRWITADTSRVALALTRTRLMAAKYPYYLLADSQDGAAKEAELTGQAVPGPYGCDIRKGFVSKRVPHVTLRAIAQNADISESMSRDEIDAAVARHAETEVLVDQPYTDTRKVRVSGRFTVESLSPHRTLAIEPSSDGDAPIEAVSFEATILENLRKAGVQNTFKGERLVFDRLDPYPGVWLQAEGEFIDADEEGRRVAVSLGPEHGTVSPDHVKEAAREALKGQGFDLLVVCGFAFDASAGERAKEFAPSGEGFAEAAEERKFGRLRVLLARMNPDLAMGNELLKKTGSGNLFMVFGEPDVELHRTDDRLVVEIHAVDVYDPTTGQVRSSSTQDIACWLIDTDYDGNSFFVRHAYFTGGQEPYESLARTLRAEISEDAWASLYATVSRPFARPDSGKIAVKVINHYGDEVLQVYEVT